MTAPPTSEPAAGGPKPPSRFLQGVARGLRRRCPNCGEGRLYKGYLSLRSPCETCGDDNDRYPSDDAAPYFTILLVGHLVVAPFLFFSFVHTAPLWIVLATVIPAILVVTLLALPYIKGAVIGAMWAMNFTRQSARFEVGPGKPPETPAPAPSADAGRT